MEAIPSDAQVDRDSVRVARLIAHARVGVASLLDLVPDPETTLEQDTLAQTPARVVKAFLEMTSGYQADIEGLFARKFRVDYDELVVVRGIGFSSLCEHHLLPFSGEATVAYLPNGQVIGLSKLPSLVHAYARRLQLQERMTEQIAKAIELYAKPRGVAVVLKARHSCLSCRGQRERGAEMITSAMLGQCREDQNLRSELLALL